MRKKTQPFTEPVNMPLMKYFCRKGYTQRIGNTATTTLAIFMPSVVIFA